MAFYQKDSEFKILKNVTGNRYAIIPKNLWQFTDDKGKEKVEGHDHLRSEVILYF